MPKSEFVAYLCGLAQREDRGALAHLRRGLGKPPGTAPETYPYVVPWLPADRPDRHEAYFLVASLFASHPEHSDDSPSLGDTFRRIGQSSEGAMAGAERRFVALLNAHRDEVPVHFRHAVAQARSEGIPVNYDALLRDTNDWGAEDRRVQRRWAGDFWQEPRSLSRSTSDETETPIEEE